MKAIARLVASFTFGLIVGVAWKLWIVDGPNGWRDMALIVSSGRAIGDASSDYSAGTMRLYVLSEGKYMERRFLNTNQGLFQMWSIGYVRSPGGASRYVVDQYKKYYNIKMLSMSKHPERYRFGEQSDRNLVRPSE